MARSSTWLTAAAPARPGPPDLTPGSDSGISDTDNLTFVTTPEFTGMAAANTTMTLYDGSTIVGTGLADAFGVWTITTDPLSEGSHTIRVRATNGAGQSSPLSTGLAIRIDTRVAHPSRPDLLAGTDTGLSSTDNITRFTRPVFIGTAQPGEVVQLLDGATVVGRVTAEDSGAWAIRATLPAGRHLIAAQAIDRAGNVSALSAALAVTVDATAPPAPSTPNLPAADDTGRSNSDNQTSVTSPVINGTAEPGARVALYDGTTTLGIATANGHGQWSIATGPLSEGSHHLRARATDIAGNTGPFSAAELLLRIDTVAPALPVIQGVADAGVFGVAEPKALIGLYNGATLIGGAVTDATGAWDVPLSLGAAGYALSTTAADLAGNTSDTGRATVSGSFATEATVKGGSYGAFGGGPGVLTLEVEGSQNRIASGVAREARIDAVGKANTLIGGIGNTTATIGGAANAVWGGPGRLDLLDTGDATTMTGGTGAATVRAMGTGMFVQAGKGPLSFIGGDNAATLAGCSGAEESATVGWGGLLFSSGGSSATISGGPGVATIFGGAGGRVEYLGSRVGAQFAAGGGSETLSAAGSSANNSFLGGGDAGAETRFIGGSDLFLFFNTSTAGQADVVTDFTADDFMYIIGYDPTLSADRLFADAQAGSDGVTLTLSDATTITFANLSSTAPLAGHIFYA